jgi:hypothetical protein
MIHEIAYEGDGFTALCLFDKSLEKFIVGNGAVGTNRLDRHDSFGRRVEGNTAVYTARPGKSDERIGIRRK